MAIDTFETLGYLEIQSLVYSAFPLEINIFTHTHTHTHVSNEGGSSCLSPR